MGKLHSQFSDDNSEELERGLIKKADTLTELETIIGVPAGSLEKTVALNNEMVDRGEDILFGRDVKTMKKYSKGPYYAIQMVASVVNTQGGPERNEQAQVIGLDGEPIPHLYECGELGDVLVVLLSGLLQHRRRYGLWPHSRQECSNCQGGQCGKVCHGRQGGLCTGCRRAQTV
jgi:hypothetical protein